ncbi:cation diffusion facilitator family transporter [Aldersonia kunmingensis]|uniref:cation diffusion facilitator family transporter n=1 Tax=Aldersonia kunmingensis TaxID=408066 RepID=UPI00082D997F|nr:cation diffusion facilitator family transporter [Aldersonia kunmingensis]
MAAEESTITVVLAFAANAAIALAKSAAAAITGSASMVAEAAHSWADTGNEVLLLIADRRSRIEPSSEHPLGFGREAYIWSMFAALGLFAVGAGVSITHGVQELLDPEPASDFGVAYAVLAISAVLEAISFRQASGQLRKEASAIDRTLLEHTFHTSDPTTRAVFAEDFGALVGLAIAFVGVLLHQLTGSPIPDALGSIAVGILLGVIAIILVDRNRRFLIGEDAPALRAGMLELLLNQPEVERVTFLRLEYLGPRRVYLTANVDLVGDAAESSVAEALRAVKLRVQENQHVVLAVLGLSTQEDVTITE